ncbi:hydrogenase maturation nickel metallochaperone HypA [Microbacterium sp.]|uniref:hydrogenase maturation nickel metallochaperone HypA n=1 Tax=Microbacterium sp. TaxID=51671 RepID=UPI0027363810|nr:hydrogenase maturation nickel metallochaperone HypA [Microbacterium sp.]MDP3950181.1 hydrogenase maturation nickel metallochaperone HypA [Microbacterium sp.]
MHELSLCNSIHTIVDRAAGGRPVATVHLQIGRFRQVVPDTLSYCWSMVSADSSLAGSQLAIEHIAVRLHCSACGAETSPAGDLVLVCGTCGSGDVSMLTGEEFMITSLDLKET